MILRAEKFTIQLKRPFRIAHGSSDTRETILVHLEDGEFTGHGEGALPPYYPSRVEDCLEWLRTVDVEKEIPPAPREAAAARVAIEIALLDLWAQRQRTPLWKIWGQDAGKIPLCAWTISIAEDEEELREMIEEGIGAGSRCFKLKLGCGDSAWDEECVRLMRHWHPEAFLSVDANAGWTVPEAARIIPGLEVDFVEQPVARELECWRELKSLLGSTPVPALVADESLQSEDDLRALSGFVQGVNIKLLKAGGLAEAHRWAGLARDLGLKVMVGVMVETGIGRTAAAQLAPLAEWLDIDSPASIPVAPLSGFEVAGDRLVLSDRPGLGWKTEK